MRTDTHPLQLARSLRIAHRLKLVATFTLLVSVAQASGCATLPPQVRPAHPDAFLGTWSGTWRSERGPWSGGVELDILADTARANGVRFTSRWTNAIVPTVSMNGVFDTGELAFEAPGGSGLRFSLHGQDDMRAKYRFVNPGDRIESGELALSRKLR